MKSADLSRREFVRNTAIATAALKLPSVLRAAAESAGPGPIPTPAAAFAATGEVELRWLDGRAPTVSTGASWGVPWPQGKHPKSSTFALRTAAGESVPVQSWPLAFWPDGSLKWTAHAIPAEAGRADTLVLAPGTPAVPAKPVRVSETADAIDIDTGVIRCTVAKKGAALIASITRDGREIVRDGRLVCLRQDSPSPDSDGVVHQETFTGLIERVTVEQAGPVRVVVKIEGRHANAARAASPEPVKRTWLPFILRLYFHAGGDAVRMMHTIVYDGDENRDFIRGLGVRFALPLHDQLHDRHVRFVGEDQGLFAEAVRGLTGLRRDPGAAVKNAQLAGLATPPLDQFPAAVRTRLHLIPAFGDWTLFQPTADSFEIRKRTKDGLTWLHSAYGRRAAGVGYAGGPSGGTAFGVRNFWQGHPAQLDIRGATGDAAEVTLWVWAPDAAPMDLRFYHDGMGETTYAEQTEGLEITYEDYEPGFEKPYGVARTSELMLWALPATPSRERLLELGGAVNLPPIVACTPPYLHSIGLFGRLWSLPDRSTPARAQIEDQLGWYFDYYHRQVEQRHWYGFWNFGDVMHTYDPDRHMWRYDVGGFAWDNSELSTDLWLWYYFLRTGRADVFRFAEAMTRHTGEVDVHHIGRFAPLGSRHNVIHWGCSAKQLRISTAANRRFYYYLTGDERVGDLLREQVTADRALVTIQPGRKLGRGAPAAPDPRATSARIGFGTDWGALSAAWLTEWERTGDPGIRDKLFNSLRTIAAQPHGFFSNSPAMDLQTGKFELTTSTRAEASHLSAVFGQAEMCAELIGLVNMPEFEQAWLQYCELFNGTAEEQQAALGHALGRLNLQQGHSRLTAFAAMRRHDARLAARAWTEFFGGEGGMARRPTLETKRVEGPAVLNPVDEAAWVSTNSTAQWGLAAIQNLALVPEALPA
jgi:hypothetical protein